MTSLEDLARKAIPHRYADRWAHPDKRRAWLEFAADAQRVLAAATPGIEDAAVERIARALDDVGDHAAAAFVRDVGALDEPITPAAVPVPLPAAAGPATGPMAAVVQLTDRIRRRGRPEEETR
jgi:hypothetical protein